MLVSGIFKQLRIFVVVPNVLSKFSKIGNLFFWDEVYDVSVNWKCILLSVTDNFGLGKWVKIERNDGKVLRIKTSPVDWRVYMWEQWIGKSRLHNRMGFSYIFSWSCQVWLLAPPFFPNVLTSFAKCQKLKRKVNFQLVFEPEKFFKLFSFGYNCFMIVLWLEIHGVFLRFFSLIWFGNLCCNCF